jgi:hypothetical protein
VGNYRSQVTTGPGATGLFAGQLEEALGWGALCGVFSAIAGILGLSLGSDWYPTAVLQLRVDLALIQLSWTVGFTAGVALRLVRPNWSRARAWIAILILSAAHGGFMVRWCADNVPPQWQWRPEHRVLASTHHATNSPIPG